MQAFTGIYLTVSGTTLIPVVFVVRKLPRRFAHDGGNNRIGVTTKTTRQGLVVLPEQLTRFAIVDA